MEIMIQNLNGVNVVSSRVVAEQLGKRHADVLSKIKEVLNEREFSLVDYTDAKGEKRPEMLLTKDGFILLCMNYTGYNEFKRAYISEFNRMETALRALDEKKLLLASLFSDDKEEVVNAHKKLVEIEKAEAVKPVQEALDVKTKDLDIAMTQIHNLIELGKGTTFDINQVSKLLGYAGLGSKNLFQLMREKKILNLNNTPNQELINTGRFVSTLKKNKYTGENYSQTRVTIAGLFWLGNKLREFGYQTIVTEDMLIQQIDEIVNSR